MVWVNGRVVTSNIIEIMVHDMDGRNPAKLRSNSRIYRHLARCGPGMVAYWAVENKARSQIERTDVVTGYTTRLTDGPVDDAPSCTADGATLVYVRCADHRCFMTRKSVDSGKLFDLCELGSDNSEYLPALSADGTRVIFLRERV